MPHYRLQINSIEGQFNRHIHTHMHTSHSTHALTYTCTRPHAQAASLVASSFWSLENDTHILYFNTLHLTFAQFHYNCSLN